MCRAGWGGEKIVESQKAFLLCRSDSYFHGFQDTLSNYCGGYLINLLSFKKNRCELFMSDIRYHKASSRGAFSFIWEEFFTEGAKFWRKMLKMGDRSDGKKQSVQNDFLKVQ